MIFRRVHGLATLALLALVPAGTAQAAAPLKIREAFPGTPAQPGAEYVELQMSADGQGDVAGQELRFYEGDGDLIGAATYALSAGDAAGLSAESQRTVLLATAEAGTLLGGDAAAPDVTLSSSDRLDPAAGAVCFTASGGGSPADCLSWGSFPIPGLGDPPLLPDPQSANAPAFAAANAAEEALERDIGRGCATYLDGPDDTGSGAADFDLAAPSPRANATAPTEVRCPPAAGIVSGPVTPFENPTNSDSAAFTYVALPSEPGVEFQCHLDFDPGQLPGATVIDEPSEPEWEAEPCTTQPHTYEGLADGFYRFWVRAKGENPEWGLPASRGWQVDTAPPQTTITSTPPEPSSGFEAAFSYSSSEPFSSFRCQLDSGAIQNCGSSAGSSSKSYFGLTDGAHAFRVWATDNAGNQDPIPAEHAFTVFTDLGDFTPPDTLLLIAPSNPSTSPDAFFAYSSSEPNSTFQCRLDGAAFAPCPAVGQGYGPLRNGVHSFEVRATDRAGNVDSVPASYSWRVAAPLPNTRFTKAPPGRVRLRKKARFCRKGGTGAGASKRRRCPQPLVFRYRADKPGSTFRCRLDRQKFRRCGAVKRIVAGPGRHRFEVYAVDSLGNAETTPARRIFRVVKPGGGGLFD